MTPTTPPTPIDFADIRSRCPRAFAALEKHLYHDWHITDAGELQYLIEEVAGNPVVLQYNPRDLFDFFDQQGVYVTAIPLIVEPVEYCFCVTIECISAYSPTYPTRGAAEAAAFTAGFERLEQMLNQKEG